MPITLHRFASGDTDYVGKHNSNYASIEGAVNPLVEQVNQATEGPVAAVAGFEALFGPTSSALLDEASYKITPTVQNEVGGTISISSGYAWLIQFKKVVGKIGVTEFGPATSNFLWGVSSTKYLYIDSGGGVYLGDANDGTAFYKIEWRGTAFWKIDRLVPYVFGATMADDARTSDTLGITYDTVGERIDAVADMLAEAIAGYQTLVNYSEEYSVAITGVTNTLSAANSKHAYFKLTGVTDYGDSTTLTFTVASLPKLFCVYNGGDYPVRLGPAAAGDTIRVLPGKTILLAADTLNAKIRRADSQAQNSYRSVTVTSGGTLQLDWTDCNTIHVQLDGDFTPQIQHTGAVPGQRLNLLLKQDGDGSNTVTWGDTNVFGTDLPSITLSTSLDKTDMVSLVYDWVAQKYNVVGLVRGF